MAGPRADVRWRPRLMCPRTVIKVPEGAVLRGCKKTRRKLREHLRLRAEIHSQLRMQALVGRPAWAAAGQNRAAGREHRGGDHSAVGGGRAYTNPNQLPLLLRVVRTVSRDPSRRRLHGLSEIDFNYELGKGERNSRWISMTGCPR
ncbi:hypothetical protein HaLaN_22434 [Haematococcus lacustris]|uniref:Uncharacterized protein n=1 Tax=Haematococcus lacustris TaxID=44745 RepID=A0A699ZTU2_HAELA|nr:hypothetical protein HaLaN_22434 [Haematococcus lacustris]